MSIADERKFAFLGSENLETQKAIKNILCSRLYNLFGEASHVLFI